LNDHGIASSGKKRPQTNHARCRVKEILTYAKAREGALSSLLGCGEMEIPLRTSSFAEAPAEAAEAAVANA
jgi:hypothetical protein